MRVTAVRCALIGSNPVVRIATDEGVDGYGEIENAKPYLQAVVGIYEPHLLADPREVERTMLRIRRMAGSKPWGSVPARSRWRSGISPAKPPDCRCTGCWAARCGTGPGSNGAVRFPMAGRSRRTTPRPCGR